MKINNFLSENEIKLKIHKLANEISKKYKKKKLTLLCILKGSFIFASDLMRELENNKIFTEIFFINAKSYDGFNSTGNIKILGDLSFVKNKNILVIEDIYDTGLTLKKIINEILKYKPNSLEVCVLLYKKKSRKNKIKIDYIGFKIPDKFVVGYGLDYNEKFRGLPFIGILETDGD